MSPLRRYLEHAVPSEFSEFRHMCMEHVHAGMFVAEFQNATLCLPLKNGIGEFAGSQTGAGGVVVEKVRMQMEGVEQVEFQNVDEINANRFADLDLDGIILIMKRHGDQHKR